VELEHEPARSQTAPGTFRHPVSDRRGASAAADPARTDGRSSPCTQPSTHRPRQATARSLVHLLGHARYGAVWPRASLPRPRSGTSSVSVLLGQATGPPLERLSGAPTAHEGDRRGGRAGPEAGRSTGSSASVAESQPGQFVLQPLLFTRVAGLCEALGKLVEASSLLFAGLQARLNQLCDHAAGARLPPPCQGPDAAGDAGGQADALTQRLVGRLHA